MCQQIFADFFDLERQISQEASGAICGGIIIKANVVSIGGAIGLVDDVADGIDTIRIIA